MLKLLAALTVLVVLIVLPVVRAIRRFCWRSPGSRPFLLVSAISILSGVAIITPRLDRLAPHMRESPAGLIPTLGAAAAVGLAALLAVAVVAGVISSLRPERPDPEA